MKTAQQGSYIVEYRDLIKYGHKKADNSTIMLLRLLDKLEAKKIYLAGFDGFSENKNNYATDFLENKHCNVKKSNSEVLNIFSDYLENREYDIPVEFITSSFFEQALSKE
ncbi:hypothetical protein [Clostridium sp. AM58-1XD]|uniref:hypothetical protein n=1 Tax=Clostridium sp. AM58-1XD TaxID=2292307 RepID=UPI000E53B3E0|nr:hypothetical protein [Clostridium sp. AM58-1XD]RGY94364.1 hypothetical protein DXA13_20635 [Clostridium sp. AM58-1XD]